MISGNNQFLQKLNECRNEKKDEEYCSFSAQCQHSVCRVCYKWVCRKLMKENAKKICKKILRENNENNEIMKRECKKRQKSGKWLTPAFMKKKQKKFKHKFTKDKSVNSKTFRKLKLRSTHRRPTKPPKKNEKMFFPLELLHQDLSNQPNIKYYVT